MVIRSLFIRFGADTSNFTRGTEEIKKDLTALNIEFNKNKNIMSDVNSQLKDLQKEQKKYTGNTQHTKEETEAYKKNEAEIRKLNLQKAQLKTVEQELKAKISNTTKELRNQNSTAQSGISIHRSLANALKALALGMTGKKLVEGLFGSNAEMEQYKTTFEVLLGSAEKANALMKDLTSFAAKTPFQLDQTTNAVQLLLSYGVAQDQIMEKMEQLGNLSMGNAEKLDRVSLAYGQMLAKGKVTGEELRQMTEAGVPLLQALADTLGVSTANLQDMISKGEVGIPTLDKAIEGLTTGTGRFAGMMEKQSQTMNGLLSTLKDNIKQFGREAGEEGFDVLKLSLSGLMKEMKKAQETGDFSRLAKEIGSGIGNVVAILVKLIQLGWEYREVLVSVGAALAAYKMLSSITASLEAFRQAQKEATVAQAAFNAVVTVNPLILLLSALTAVTAAAVIFGNETSEVSQQLAESQNAVDDLNSDLEDMKNGGLKGSVEGMNDLAELSDYLVPKIEELGSNTNRSAAENQRLETYIKEVNSALGYEAYAIDQSTGALMGNTDEIYKNIEALKKRAMAEAAFDKLKQAQEAALDAELNLQKAKENQAKYQSDPFVTGLNGGNGLIDRYTGMINLGELQAHQADFFVKESERIKNEANDTVNDLSDFLDSLGVDYSDFGKKVEDENRKMVSSTKQSASAAKKALSSWLSSMKKEYDKYYKSRKKQLESFYEEELKSIDASVKAEEKRINGLIDAIDKEIEARKRLKEDTDSQKQIDAVTARLKYEQLDDFSRKELERELKRLKEEKEETEWQREQADKKEALRDELEAFQERAQARKEAIQEEKEAMLEALEQEKESMQEVFDFISENFTSLAQLKAAGINNLNDLFLLVTKRENAALNNTFSLLQTRTLEVGNLYADTVNRRINETFENCVRKAKEAIAELESAVGRAYLAAGIVSTYGLETVPRANKNVSQTYINRSTYNIQRNMTESQMERRILGSLFDYTDTL